VVSAAAVAKKRWKKKEKKKMEKAIGRGVAQG
jgi:hypothetical protein